jgi:hypothetical protein
MKKYTLFLGFICLIGSAFGQAPVAPAYDSSFKAIYKAAALHPGYINMHGVMHDSVVRRWDRDIVIYITGEDRKSRKEILDKLKNTIAVVTPALGNKIKISFTDDLARSNYLIDLDFRGRSTWLLRWDNQENIYNCRVLVDTKHIFNLDQQADLISHYFIKSLGDFVFSWEDRTNLIKNNASVASNMSHWRQDINGIDLAILKVHYADDIKPGMNRAAIDQYFEKHSN